MRRLLTFLKRIRVRLTLWYVFLLAVVLIIFGAVLYTSLKASLLDEVDTSLYTMGEQVAASLDYEDSHLSFQNEEPQDFLGRLASQGYVFRLTDEAGKPLEGAGPFNDVFNQTLDLQKGFQTIDVLGDRWRVYTMKILTSTGRNNVFLQVGESLGRVDSTLSKLLFFEVIAVPLALVLAIAVGMFVAGRALRPIERITQLAGSIKAVDLSRRLDLDLPDDELGRLAGTFNDMLERLEEGFAHQKRFVSEAAHELRTPLTIMKGTAEVCLNRDRAIDEYKEALEELRDEIDHLAEVAEDLLTLSSADSESPILDIQDLDLCEVVRSAVELITPLAENKGIDIQFNSAGLTPFRGDKNKLSRMFLNLLDNAVKYSPPKSTISVSVTLESEGIIAAVGDSGPGIKSDEVESIFNPFHRLEEAREKNPSGSGLGLSIARWIARAHGGDIRVESRLGRGSAFKVVFPRDE